MKRCKRDGENMNNQGVVNADRISDLPEALILQILSLLPTKVAIATSILSKQWQFHWKMLPKLEFDSHRHKLKVDDVYRSLLSHKAPVLQSLFLRVRLHTSNNALDTCILIGIALTRNVRELVLDVASYIEFFTYPRCLFNSETLETLELWNLGFISMDVPSIVCLKSLRTLHLHYMNFKDDEILSILSGCPNLQNFEVHRHAGSRVKTITIALPSLQRLSINNNNCIKEHYMINAPCLKYLKIDMFNSLEFCMIENAPELVEATIMNASDIINEKLMESLTSVKRLSLALSPVWIEFPTGSIFYQLVSLELHTYKAAWWKLLVIMLDSSPKLQVLKLIGGEKKRSSSAKWNKPKNVPECLLLHLETFMWEGYEWDRGDEIVVAKYILSNTKHLKRVTFTPKHIGSRDRLVVVKDLESVIMDTNSCQFQFK